MGVHYVPSLFFNFTIMKIILLPSLLVVFVFVQAAAAQSAFGRNALEEGYRSVEIGKALNAMPTSGKKPEDFLPPHWKIFARADGDVNRNGVNDAVLVLQLDQADKSYIDQLPKVSGDTTWSFDTSMIVVLNDKPSKTLEFDNVNYSIGQIPQNERDEFTVQIKNGVLDVHLSTGGSLRNDYAYHFRQDPPTGGSLVLIGFDEEDYPVTMQNDSARYTLSENYLTGVRIENTERFDKAGKMVGSPKRSTIKIEKIEFSEAKAPRL
jgi:hypothetical protein